MSAHRAIPFQSDDRSVPGIRCEGCAFVIHLGDAYRIKQSNGIVVTRQIKKMKAAWAVFEQHWSGQLVTETPSPACDHCGCPCKADRAKRSWIHVYDSPWCSNTDGTMARTRAAVDGSSTVPLKLLMPS